MVGRQAIHLAAAPAAPAGASGRRSCVGIFALQGNVREHVALLDELGVGAVAVRTPGDLAGVGALVIPGGESTTIRRQLEWSGLRAPLEARIAAGMPVLGTCAGLITMARTAPDGAPPTLGCLDVEVERNGWGRQVASFEAGVDWTPASGLDGSTPGTFIRAPRIITCGPQVEVLATVGGDEPVAVRQGRLLAATFHPELAGVAALHRMLVESITEGS